MLTKQEVLQHKIVDLKLLLQNIKRWQLKNEKIVFTNGCFDILHKGHITLITEAATHGQKLIVAINSDDSIKRLKGENRPIVSQNDRAEVLAALQFVDAIIIFDKDTPKELIDIIKPNVLVKGGDYTLDTIVGADTVLANGGEVIIVNTIEGFATTNIINKIKNS